MCAFSGGVAAETVREWTPAQRRTNYLRELGKSYPGIGAAFVNDRFMNWPSDAWTRAGYSFPAPGQVTTVGPLLRKGLDHVHFAGEHASYAFVGFMEGALNSGAVAGQAAGAARRDRQVVSGAADAAASQRGSPMAARAGDGHRADGRRHPRSSSAASSRTRCRRARRPVAVELDVGARESPPTARPRELTAALTARLTPPAGTAWKDGLAAVVLVDVSGSMHDRIKGERRRKIEAAQAAAIDLVGAFARYAKRAPRARRCWSASTSSAPAPARRRRAR